MKESYRRFLVLCIVLLSAFLIVTGLRIATGGAGLLDFLKNSGPPLEKGNTQATLAEKPAIKADEVSLLVQLNEQQAKLCAAVMPSVVSINTSGQENRRVRDNLGRIRTQTERTTGQGSGVIISYEGHVITNYHVIANKQQILVIDARGRTYQAELIGSDPELDIAVIKLPQNGGFTPLKFGDSEKVKEGDTVFAFGNPFGIGKSVTDGIISAKERSISDSQGGLLQSSAAINPGYSGGPLVSIYGEIIGINSSIYSNDEKNPGFQGISFSIPSNIVKRSFNAIKEHGHPVRGFLGISRGELTTKSRSQLSYTDNFGALIQSVGDNTPAAKAGLQANDIITHFNGKTIRDFSQLIGLIHRAEVGKNIDLQVWRSGQKIILTAMVAAANSDTANIANQIKDITNPDEVLRAIGIVVSPLSLHYRRQGIHGVKVVKVLPKSLAQGLVKRNDIIYQVNLAQVHQPQHFYSHILMSSVKGETNLGIIRDADRLANPVVLPALNQL